MGTGFSFYGQQFYIKVGDRDFYIDLIFYHTRLHCHFVIELNVTDFEPEHAGKLEFYITAVDEQIKLPDDKPTIGLLLCKTTDKVIVEYTLKTKTKPMGVAEYKHVIPKEWKNELPDEKTLKLELEKEIVIPQSPVDKKINKLKQIVQRLNTDPADLEKDNNLVKKVFSEIQSPLIKLIDKKLENVKPLFKNYNVRGLYNDRGLEWNMHDYDLNARLSLDENVWLIGFEFILETFIQGGTKAFNIDQRLEIHLNKNKYIIGPERGKVWQEKVYRKFPDKEELEEIADRFVEIMVDDITSKAERILNQ